MSIHNSPGRGLKQCPACEKYVGVRSARCPNCSAEFGGSPASKAAPSLSSGFNPLNQKTEPQKPIAPAAPKVSENKVKPTPTPKTPRKKSENDPEKNSGDGSRLDRINYLKRELIKELKISSRTFGKGIVDEITTALKD